MGEIRQKTLMLSGIAMFFVKATKRSELITENVDFSTVVKAIISSPNFVAGC